MGERGRQGLPRGRRELLGVMDMSTVLIVMVSRDTHKPKLIKLYTLNMCGLLYVITFLVKIRGNNKAVRKMRTSAHQNVTRV